MAREVLGEVAHKAPFAPWWHAGYCIRDGRRREARPHLSMQRLCFHLHTCLPPSLICLHALFFDAEHGETCGKHCPPSREPCHLQEPLHLFRARFAKPFDASWEALIAHVVSPAGGWKRDVAHVLPHTQFVLPTIELQQ